MRFTGEGDRQDEAGEGVKPVCDISRHLVSFPEPVEGSGTQCEP